MVPRVTRRKKMLSVKRTTFCASVNLPAGGQVILADGVTLNLTEDAAFKASCSPVGPNIITSEGIDDGLNMEQITTGDAKPEFSDFQDPFYASTFPQCYALAAATVIAYTLVIMLMITPRTFIDGGIVILGRKGFTNGGIGTNIGGRPWLQKVAAITVAISLTIATANTFKVAEQQYSWGIQNALILQKEVMGGTELKVIRLISDTFLWLAQAQTLTRLFPRQREKVIIKWTAFALITLDVIFQALDSFQYTTNGLSRDKNQFTEAVPALSYLFELALGVLYAAWVIYYSLTKKKYAYYHPRMRNMCLVALLSVLSVFVPIVFFIMDVSKPNLAAWGDYVRWVGAAAASVFVWEWVERIEALEREEKKDGILGREVYDGDEMFEVASWTKRKKNSNDGADSSGGTGTWSGSLVASRSHLWPSLSSVKTRYRSRSTLRIGGAPGLASNTEASNHDRLHSMQPPLWPARPPQAATPVSRTDTASADSTVYRVRYRALTETTSRSTPIYERVETISRSNSVSSSHYSEAQHPDTTQDSETRASEALQAERSTRRLRSLTKTRSKPRFGNNEKQPASSQHASSGRERRSLWDFRSRFEDFAATQAERFRERIRPTMDTETLPVMVIPAPQREGAALAAVRQQHQEE